MRESAVEAGGLRFGLLETGEPGRPLVLCFHGFPDSAFTWRHLLPALAEQGYHAVAPYLRGYAPTDLPAARFGLADLATDVLALEETLRGEGASVLVGHDWGAAAVYGALLREPGRWPCAVGVAVPPAAGWSIDAVSPRQLRRSWYSFLFQLPDASVPEGLAAADDLALVDGLWADWSPGYDAAHDIDRAKEALQPPGRLTAAIRYYREAPTRLRTPAEAEAEREAFRELDVALLYLHGARDGCIGLDSAELVEPSFPPRTEKVVFDDAGHFLHLEQPDEFNRLVLDFLARNAPA